MREHQDCLDQIDAAMARERWGWAAYVEKRCQRNHANLPAFDDHATTKPDPEPLLTDAGSREPITEPTETEESAT